jgi:hypothetical protein
VARTVVQQGRAPRGRSEPELQRVPEPEAESASEAEQEPPAEAESWLQGL